jgi:hypothetical protein
MDKLDEKTVRSVASVFELIRQEETDSDHISTAEVALERLWVIWGEELDVQPHTVDSNDVENTVEFLDKFAPTREESMDYKRNNNGNNDPDRMFRYIETFVDTECRYVNGYLPSYRDWDVDYVRDGQVVESRTYEHDDEIPTEPDINGVRHTCDRTERGDGHVRIYVSKEPILQDVDILIRAEGDDFINIEAQDGPNINSRESAITTLSNEFDWGMLGDTEIIVRDNPEEVTDYMNSLGWSYRYD